MELLKINCDSSGWSCRFDAEKQKKIPDRKNRSGIALYIHRKPCQVRRRPRGRFPNVQAGLLTPGSPYWLRLPDPEVSDIMQRSSPVTAAGPSPISTEFPLKFCYEHLNV